MEKKNELLTITVKTKKETLSIDASNCVGATALIASVVNERRPNLMTMTFVDKVQELAAEWFVKYETKPKSYWQRNDWGEKIEEFVIAKIEK